MKKVLTLLLLLPIFITGCGKDKKMETPSDKVKNYLDSYINLDDNVLTDLDDMIDNMTDYNDNQKERYKKIMKKHYENISYEIKSERVDDDVATVAVEIEVFDYSPIINNEYDEEDFTLEDGSYDVEKFNDFELDLFEKVDKKTRYTITFNLSKQDDVWVIDEPDDIVIQKIHGIYAY
ncbi:MAG: hypothetical protein IKN87_03625 [Bacilli bacterium]|nr:hypothetical protein [Bacilli bacterium]